MGKFKVSTFGKWERQRQELVKSLLSDKDIATKVSEQTIHEALLCEVNTSMFEVAFNFVKTQSTTLPPEAMSPQVMKELTIESYRLSLTVVLDSLAKKLELPTSLLKPHVDKFSDSAIEQIPLIIDDVLKIGSVSVKTKNEAIDKLYGADFKKNYPSLSRQLPYEDEEVIELAREKIAQFMTENNFGANEAIIQEQFIYLNEIAQQISATPDFKEQFQTQTGKSMSEYKIAHREKLKNAVTPFWTSDAVAQKSAPEVNEGLKLN